MLTGFFMNHSQLMMEACIGQKRTVKSLMKANPLPLSSSSGTSTNSHIACINYPKSSPGHLAVNLNRMLTPGWQHMPRPFPKSCG